MKIAIAADVAAALAFAMPAAIAQTNPGAASDRNSTVPEKVQAPPGNAPMTGRSSDSLSDKLDQSNGVIQPNSGVDPGMTKAPPSNAGSMPVIKPQGTPGGSPGPQAK